MVLAGYTIEYRPLLIGDFQGNKVEFSEFEMKNSWLSEISSTKALDYEEYSKIIYSSET